MPRIFLILILFLLIPSTAFADVEKDIKEYNTNTLPFNADSEEVDTSDQNPIIDFINGILNPVKIHEYANAYNKKEEARNINVFLGWLSTVLANLTGVGATEYGNQNAADFVRERYPFETADKRM